MAAAPPSTYHSHLDPGDLRLRLTSRSSYGRKYQSKADPTYNHKDKSGDHVTRSGSCYRHDSSVEDSTNSSPAQAAEAETLQRSINRKRKPEFCTRGRDSWKVIPRYRYPEQSPPREESGYPLSEVSDAVMCRAFPTTLRKAAHACRSRRKNSASLLNIVQERNESLACFLGRFNAATLEIDNLDESVKYTAFLRGLRPISKFAFSVNKSPPGGKSAKRPKRDERRPKDTFNLTPLNAKPSQILHEIKDNKVLQWPDRMKSRPNKRNKDLWCHFHNDHGHTTDNCGSLKRVIEAPLKRGQLRKFVAPGEGRQQTPPATEEREDREENAGTINTISGGIAAEGPSGKARKAYAREVYVTSPHPNKKLKTVPAAKITFSGDDSDGIKTPHDDPLVITIKAGNFDVKRVLIDNGSSAKILFHDAFKKMNIFQRTVSERWIHRFAVSTVLIREEDGVQKPIYYVSKVLQDVETRYLKIDKIALALIISARRLRPYFQSHTIVVLTDQPLQKVLMSPEASGRLVNWSVELGEFDLQYKPRTGVKAQALADFIVECTLPEDPPQLVISKVTDPWNLYVDGSSAVGNSGAGIILISPEGFTIEYALRFRYALVEGTLYKKSFSLPYLRCLRPSESLYALQEVHEGICGQHLGGRIVAQKILRQGYYWPTMQKDAIEFTRRCDQCQKFAPLSHTPVAPLTSIVSPIPFAVWGMDLLGPFPMASGQRRFVIVAIDYFTKWTKAESLAAITSAKCEDFFWKNIVCRFGVPRALVVDNGK
ncbi:hypothetical protein RJ639_030646 [Escallonia herrerae]|uniref:Integrase catalytic domain-containing protein n=1 Tax=Escallonia herrerae TaxID=1293975 RepID=A0AA88WYH6_9ASTE|nr:hypothetical protein RJ639_030646 [Escallonia herrerae]